MYWNSSRIITPKSPLLINRNMRCIEISELYLDYPNGKEINRNMRCIEIYGKAVTNTTVTLINRNMRCIEICF